MVSERAVCPSSSDRQIASEIRTGTSRQSNTIWAHLLEMKAACGSTREGVSAPSSESATPQTTTDCQVGLSFGYNQAEDESHTLTGTQAIRLLIDVASNGGNLLLNVGPEASGAIPPLQLQCLQGMADWMSRNSSFVHGTRVVGRDIANPAGPSEYLENKGDQGPSWVRWLKKGSELFAFVDADDNVRLEVDWNRVDRASARTSEGVALEVDHSGMVKVGSLSRELFPGIIIFDLL